ncbi:MAG: S1C family serine protease [Anaerolineae bacterium]
MVAIAVLGCSSSALPVATKEPPPTATPIVIVATPTPLPRSAFEAMDIEEQLVINVYERVSPAVVNITSRTYIYGFFFNIIPQEGSGSGFVIDKEGHILTNYHVVEGAEELEVALSDDTVVPGEVIGIDPSNDLAVIVIDVPAEKLYPVEWGTSANLRVGQRAIAIGNPFGQFERTLTTGVISALNRSLETEKGRRIWGVIQTDAAINRGNSGGPLLDSHGRVIGVNTAIFSPSGTSAGIGFAIPADTVKRIVPELISKGRYPHPWLGIEPYSITPILARALDLPAQKGLLIARLYRNSPADKAGLQGARERVRIGNKIVLAGGDIITHVNGRQIANWDDWNFYLDTETRVGDEVELTIIRGGQEMLIKATLAERPPGV